MPKGNPSAQTIASEKYQKKAGYMAKSFKLKRDIVEQFEEACRQPGGADYKDDERIHRRTETE